MKMTGMTMAAFLAAGAAFAATPVEEKIASGHKILVSDEWGGGHRMIFEFEGRKGWVVEPKAPRADRPWMWTMQWMGAYINRTGAPMLTARGYYHVHLEAFDTRCDEEGLKALASFQSFLVKELGFAPKAYLIGMSWGGFYSVRYATTYPENVKKIYLDAPLLNFHQFAPVKAPTEAAKSIGSWGYSQPQYGKTWSDDPRMPVNMAERLAKTGIPIYLLYGGQDQTVNPKLNCEPFIDRFKAAGGTITVEKRWAYGHHPHGFEHEDLDKIAKFFE